MTVAWRGRSVARASAVTATRSTTSDAEERGRDEASRQADADHDQAAQADDAPQERGPRALLLEVVEVAALVPDVGDDAEQHADEREPERHDRGGEEGQERPARERVVAQRALERRARVHGEHVEGPARELGGKRLARRLAVGAPSQTSFATAAPGRVALSAVESIPRSATTKSSRVPGNRSATAATWTVTCSPAIRSASSPPGRGRGGHAGRGDREHRLLVGRLAWAGTALRPAR